MRKFEIEEKKKTNEKLVRFLTFDKVTGKLPDFFRSFASKRSEQMRKKTKTPNALDGGMFAGLTYVRCDSIVWIDDYSCYFHSSIEIYSIVWFIFKYVVKIQT